MDRWDDRMDIAVLRDDPREVERLLLERDRWKLLLTRLRRLLCCRPSRSTALHLAAYANSMTAAEILLAHSFVEVDYADVAGHSPLHVAAYHNSWEVADLLISYGAKLEVINRLGQTPLSLAVAQGNAAIVGLITLAEGIHCRRK